MSSQIDPAMTNRNGTDAHHACGADRPKTTHVTGSTKQSRCSSKTRAVSAGEAVDGTDAADIVFTYASVCRHFIHTPPYVKRDE